MRQEKARLGNHLLLCLNTPICLSQCYTVVLLRVLRTNVICVAIDVVQGTHMPILGMNALNEFVQFATKDDMVECDTKWEHI